MYDEQKHPIDLTEEAIATNRDALLGIVAWLFTMLGLEERSNRALPRMQGNRLKIIWLGW
jgi:hypothetical protein